MSLPCRMPLRALLVVVPVAVLAATLTGCEGVAAGQEAARDACAAYAKTERTPTATTTDQAGAARGRAPADARSAAAANTTWATLQRDIESVYSRGVPPQSASADELDAYFAADRRVQADCAAAGQDIGPRRP